MAALIAVGLLAILFSTTHENASHVQAAGPASISLSATSGAPGVHLVITGSGFQPGENVQPIWNYTGPGTGVAQKSFYEYNPIGIADASGNVVATLWTPAAIGGTYTIAAHGLTSGLVATASFTLTASLELGEYIGQPGTVLRLRGWAFGNKESVKFYWNWSQSGGGQLIGTANADTKGDWSGRTYTIPAGTANGAYTLAAIGQTSNEVATAQFTVGTVPTSAAPGPGDWPNFGYDLQGTRVNPTETTLSTTTVPTLAVKWKAATPLAPYKIIASPVVANGIVYIGTMQGDVLAYNAATGALIWDFSAAGSIYGSPTIANGIAYFGTVKYAAEYLTGNYIYAVNAATGALIWENYLTLGSVWVPPTVVNGVIYTPTALKEGVSGGFYAFDALTGATIWSLSTKEGNWSPPTIDPSGSNLYFATGNPCLSKPTSPNPSDGCSGSVFDVNPATGVTIWSYHIPDYTGDDDIPSSPAYSVFNGTPYVVVGTKSGVEYAFNPATGVVLWSYDTGVRGDSGTYSSPAIYNGLVYFGSGDRIFHVLDLTTGLQVWSYSIKGQATASAAVANGVVYVADTGKKVHAFDITTHALLWEYYFGNFAPVYSSPVISNGALYIAASDGYLYAFTPNGQ